MYFKLIEDAQEKSRFLDRFDSYVGVRLPDSYASQGQMTGLYDELGTLVGGYMLITQPEFRIPNLIPEDIKKQHNFFHKASPNDIVEVNGVWLARKASRGMTPRRFWLRMLSDIIKCKRRYLLLMADALNGNVQNVHRDLRPTFIFRGKPELQPGMASHREIVVSYVTRTNLIFGRFVGYLFAPSVLRRTPAVRWVNRQIKLMRA